ncbi:MAG: histidinol phosphate phosphatase [Desulfobacteraceae bacterium]|nr:MAG: histidinol phosphate phosphatase [Desulfobacteraceae bacterium]
MSTHVHLERGPYTRDWVRRFTDTARERGVAELYLLEHSHRFQEFGPLYADIAKYNEYQALWFQNQMKVSLSAYTDLIGQCRREEYPVKIHWGLEIYYIPGKEEIIADILEQFEFDFTTGSIHWIDHWGFDHKAEFWKGRDVDQLYDRYYESMVDLVKSGLFGHLAHPDSIKCFNHYPKLDQTEKYLKLARVLKTADMAVEFSSGLVINYGHKELGINRTLLNILKKEKIKLITASDAHRLEDVGRWIRESLEIIGK